MRTLTIILDSNEYIFGLTEKKEPSDALLAMLSNFTIKIPRIILDELHQNMRKDELKSLYKLIRDKEVVIIEDKIPASTVDKYKKQLHYEDAVTASYCEYFDVDILISENRHFLVNFHPKAFRVLSASEFLKEFSNK